MITPALINYIQTNLAVGKSKDKIKSELLLAGGWQEHEVDEAFMTLDTGPYKKTPTAKAGSFFMTFFIIIIILGGLAFAADKLLGSSVSDVVSNIVAVLPFGHTATPDTSVIPSSMIQPVLLPKTDPQTPAVADPSITALQQASIQAAAQAATPTTPSVQPITPPVPTKCTANDTTCLLQAVAACNPATETSTTVATTPADASGKTTKETSLRSYTISSAANNQCTMAFTVKSDTVSKFRAKAASCTLPTTDIATVLTNWTTGDFYTDTGVDLYGKCTGTYFNN
jgi:hypothetical protein